MSELITPVTLQRSLITPTSEIFTQLQSDLVRKVGEHLPLDQDLVRFAVPGAMAISIAGGNVIELAYRTAMPGSELVYMEGSDIANRLIGVLPRTAAHEVRTRSFANRTVGGRADRRTFGAQLYKSDIIYERLASLGTLRLLGGLPRPSARTEKLHSVALVMLRTDEYSPRLEDELAEIADAHVPPGTEFVFNKVMPVDLATSVAPFVPAAELPLSS
jgi:hypothetical protein